MFVVILLKSLDLFYFADNQTCVQMDWEWDGLVKCTMGQSIFVVISSWCFWVYFYLKS